MIYRITAWLYTVELTQAPGLLEFGLGLGIGLGLGLGIGLRLGLWLGLGLGLGFGLELALHTVVRVTYSSTLCPSFVRVL